MINSHFSGINMVINMVINHDQPTFSHHFPMISPWFFPRFLGADRRSPRPRGDDPHKRPRLRLRQGAEADPAGAAPVAWVACEGSSEIVEDHGTI